MSKVRNLPETTSLTPSDLFYAIDVSEGPNAGRKVTVQTIKDAVIADAAEIPYNNTNSTLDAENVKDAIDEVDTKVNNHSDRHAPDASDALPTAAPVDADADGNNNIGNGNAYSRHNHKHNIATGNPVEITDSTTSAGTGSALVKANHQHPHGNRGGGSLHAPVTISADGFMSAADKVKLNAMVFGFLAYTNTANQSTTQSNAAYTAITLDSDLSSFPNSLLTKTSATQFRTDFVGYIRVSFKIRAQDISGNDVAWRAALLSGGTVIPHTEIRGNGKTNADRYNTPSGSFLIPCTNGEIFSFGFSNAEAATTDTITIYASGASVSIQAVYKTA